VESVVALLKHGLQVDYVVLGGGQTKYLKALPPGARLGTNGHAILGGVRLWNEARHRHPARRPHLSRSRRKPSSIAVAVAEGASAPSPS
jgi:hypothetical protein